MILGLQEPIPGIEQKMDKRRKRYDKFIIGYKKRTKDAKIDKNGQKTVVLLLVINL